MNHASPQITNNDLFCSQLIFLVVAASIRS